MIRVLPTDTEIRGHLLPAGTMVTWYAKVIGQDTGFYPLLISEKVLINERFELKLLILEQFSRPEEFIPERWIDEKNTIHPFAVRNFSHGPRMCIGKRFAELEVQLGVAKLIQVRIRKLSSGSNSTTLHVLQFRIFNLSTPVREMWIS